MSIVQPTLHGDELAALLALAEAKTVLELGSGYGHTTVHLAQVAERVWSVDWHQGDAQTGRQDSLPAYIFRVRQNDPGRIIVSVVGRFQQVLPLLRLAEFDLIFHDGLHTAEAVAQDLRLALPLLRWGGWVACHDYGNYGVRAGSFPSLGEPDQRVRSLAIWRPDLGHWRT